MDTAKDIRDFLMTRRAKITPEQVGLPSGGRRRVAGLRREEVALLAGVSAEYYIQVERGQVAGVSDDVLGAIARTLQLDDVETTHLFDLARAATPRAGGRSTRRRTPGMRVPEGVQALMDEMVTAPAVVQNGRLDLLAGNPLGRALYTEVIARAAGVPNLARFIFLDDLAAQVFPAWEKAADDAVALLRVEAARSPQSTAVTGLVGELATRSEDFRVRWAAHDVKAHVRGVKQFRHPAVGDLTLRFEAFEIAGDRGLTMIGYTAEAGSASHEALRLLASWSATERESAAQPAPDHTGGAQQESGPS